jgi:hypothetical protein
LSQSDKQRRHRAATAAAMKRRMESRKCPSCQRRGAIIRQRVDVYAVLRKCRYCSYEKIIDTMPKE